MRSLWALPVVLLAFSGLCLGNGLQVKFPVIDGAGLGAGINVATLTVMASPFTAESIQAAITNPSGAEFSQYSSQITDQSSFQKTTEIAAELEGTGWGVSVSASAKLLKSKAVNSYSVIFTLGASTTSQIYELDYMKLQLTEHAKALLESDWKAFLQVYGRFFVVKKTAGGSFLGITSISVETTSEKSSTELAASLSLENPMVSGSASFNFKKNVESSSSSMKVSSRYLMTGAMPAGELNIDVKTIKDSDGNEVDEKDITVEEIRAAFADWKEKVGSSAYYLTMSLLDMASVPAVIEVIGTDKNARNAFTQPLNEFFIKDFANVYAGLQYCKSSLESFEYDANVAGLSEEYLVEAAKIRRRIRQLDQTREMHMVILTSSLDAAASDINPNSDYVKFLKMPKLCLKEVSAFRSSVVDVLPRVFDRQSDCYEIGGTPPVYQLGVKNFKVECQIDEFIGSWQAKPCQNDNFFMAHKCWKGRIANSPDLQIVDGSSYCIPVGNGDSGQLYKLRHLVGLKAECDAGFVLQKFQFKICGDARVGPPYGLTISFQCQKASGLGLVAFTKFSNCVAVEGAYLDKFSSFEVECGSYAVLTAFDFEFCDDPAYPSQVRVKYTCVSFGVSDTE